MANIPGLTAGEFGNFLQVTRRQDSARPSVEDSQQKKKLWCREQESNLQGTKYRRILSPLRLPVPPSRLGKIFLLYGRCADLNTVQAGCALRSAVLSFGSSTRKVAPTP